MAVIVQKMVGVPHGTRFYPDFSGVAKSYNFYPVPPQKPLDGIVAVALGLGKTIVDGGVTVRFCPKYPNHLLQFFSTAEAIINNQNQFFALDMTRRPLRRSKHVTCLLGTLAWPTRKRMALFITWHPPTRPRTMRSMTAPPGGSSRSQLCAHTSEQDIPAPTHHRAFDGYGQLGNGLSRRDGICRNAVCTAPSA